MKQVLLVGKASLFRQSLGLILKWNADFKEAVEADSLAEARRILSNSDHRPDLTVVDLALANVGGIQLIEELHMIAPGVPVLAITLRGDADQRDRALRAGAAEVLTMAASPREIVDVAKRLVGE